MLFTGRLTADAAVKAVKDNRQVINFTVAINQKWKNKDGEMKDKTAFVDCAYWRSSGIAQYLIKGAVAEISGWMEAQAYKGKTDGLRAKLFCTCDTVKLFSVTPKGGSAMGSNEMTATAKSTGNHTEEDDLPF